MLSKSALCYCLSYDGCAAKSSPCLHGASSGKFAASALDEGDLLASHTLAILPPGKESRTH